MYKEGQVLRLTFWFETGKYLGFSEKPIQIVIGIYTLWLEGLISLKKKKKKKREEKKKKKKKKWGIDMLWTG